MVGTTDAFAYTCYSSVALTSAVTGFLKYYETSGVTSDKLGLIVDSGFSPLPKAWRTAIVSTFITPVKTGAHATNGLNLNISTAGTGTQCSAANIVGG